MTIASFDHNHIHCLMTTQDFRILKGNGVQEHKIQGTFGILSQILSPMNKNTGVNWKIIQLGLICFLFYEKCAVVFETKTLF